MLPNILASAPLPTFGSMVWIIETRISEMYVDLDSVRQRHRIRGSSATGYASIGCGEGMYQEQDEDNCLDA